MSSEVGFEIDPSILAGFLEETREALGSLDPLFIQLETDPYNSSIIGTIFRSVHSIKGNAPFFGLMRLKNLAHDLESVLAALRDKKISPSKRLFNLLLAGVDQLKVIIDRVAGGLNEVADEALFSGLIDSAKKAIAGGLSQDSESSAQSSSDLERIKSALQSWSIPESDLAVRDLLLKIVEQSSASITATKILAQPAASTAPVVPQQPLQKSSAEGESAAAPKDPPAHKNEASKSMRVSEERIDTFLSFVGELVIAQDMLRHFSTRMQIKVSDPELMHELAVVNGVIANLGAGLEKAIMSIRKVPVKNLLQKVPRLIRDIATAKGKEINVEIIGDDLEIDKSLLELLDAPIAHMARNAADHGIETPELRKKSGKVTKGTVRVHCSESATDIVLAIQDDGGGLNFAALQRKAESLGLFKTGEVITNEQAVDLIFMAGVSTAQEVSDVSGRGVGMDVVKRNVEAAGGSITVKSEAGKGSEFILRLPKSVTTQIMQGFVVQVDDFNLVLPLNQVRESWCNQRSEVTHIVSQGPHVLRHDQILPLLDLRKFLELNMAEVEDEERDMIVTIEADKQPIAIKVNQIIGPRQVVLKPLEELANTKKLFLGGALLGDGSVALVLDLSKLSISHQLDS